MKPSATRQAVHLLGGVERVRTRVRGFAPWSPEKATLALLDQVQGILDEYADHLPLTIRQIFYRLVGASRQHRPRRLTTAPSAAKPVRPRRCRPTCSPTSCAPPSRSASIGACSIACCVRNAASATG